MLRGRKLAKQEAIRQAKIAGLEAELKRLRKQRLALDRQRKLKAEIKAEKRRIRELKAEQSKVRKALRITLAGLTGPRARRVGKHVWEEFKATMFGPSKKKR